MTIYDQYLSARDSLLKEYERGDVSLEKFQKRFEKEVHPIYEEHNFLIGLLKLGLRRTRCPLVD